MENYTFCVPCLLGIEGLIADELKFKGFSSVRAENGRVYFEGTMQDCARANVVMRCGERVLLRVGAFRATTFDELFEGTKAIAWENYLDAKSAFPVKGYSIGSKLFSVSDCQSIIKKATVDHLKGIYNESWFEETGAKYQIQFAIMNDNVEIYIDTTGPALYKRGYRLSATLAPLRETLAAATVKLTRYRGREDFLDPFCGSGTIAIEAAMLANNIQPGARRNFDAENWDFCDKTIWQAARDEAIAGEKHEKLSIIASDISTDAITLAKQNAARAGVEDCITIRRADALSTDYSGFKGILLANPPYGVRLLDIEEAQHIYKRLGGALRDAHGLKKYILTADEKFEQHFGAVASKRRKLYNGMIKCQIYMYT